MQGKGRRVGLWGNICSILAMIAVLPRSIWKKRLNSASLFGRNGGVQPVYLEETVEFNRLFQIDRDKTASVARN